MDNNKLKRFWQDKETKDIILEFLTANLAEIAVQRVMNREDTSSLADAQEVINKSFNALDDLFDKPKEVLPMDEAR